MNKYTVTAVFAEDTGKLYGTDTSSVRVGGYGMRNALTRLIRASRDFTVFAVSVTDSYASLTVPKSEKTAVFSAVCREFRI